MPDISQEAVHQFWYEFQDPMIYRTISFMEGVEDWCIDGDPQFEEALKALGDTLEDIGNIDLKLEENMIDVIAQVKTGRGLRLLMCLDVAYPGAAAKILMHAEQITKSQQDASGSFLRRNVVFERLRLLSRVFSEERFKLITKALEDGVYD
jgi:intracellular multiplication protein IcmW